MKETIHTFHIYIFSEIQDNTYNIITEYKNIII